MQSILFCDTICVLRKIDNGVGFFCYTGETEKQIQEADSGNYPSRNTVRILGRFLLDFLEKRSFCFKRIRSMIE